jgi:protein-L-isoaspartate(D-aspartate) O-methyltransferase
MIDYDAARRAMVDRQVRPSDVTRYAIVDAMLSTPRERFVPRALREVAYADAAIPLGDGRALLEPRTFAKMLEVAEIGAEDLVLDVGCACGYSAVVASRMAAAVVGLEADEAMARQAADLGAQLEAHNLIVEHGTLAAGAPEAGPYDVILVEGGLEIEPSALLAQLKEGGRLVGVWMEGAFGHCRVWTRAGGAVSRRRAFDAAAPLLPGFDSAETFVL